MSIIEGLCKGHGCLDRAEMITLTAILKAATTPKTEPDGDIAKGNSEDEDFFHQLFMSFSDGESKETNSEESKTR